LDSGIGFWNWILELDSGIGFYNLILKLNLGIGFWNWILRGIKLWTIDVRKVYTSAITTLPTLTF
jgi:hypothetical protein